MPLQYHIPNYSIMKRRLFLSTSAIAGTSVLASAQSLSGMNHYLQLQQLNGEQKSQLKLLKEELKKNLSEHQYSTQLASKICQINRVNKVESKGNDYLVSLSTEANQEIQLIKKKGQQCIKFIG